MCSASTNFCMEISLVGGGYSWPCKEVGISVCKYMLVLPGSYWNIASSFYFTCFGASSLGLYGSNTRVLSLPSWKPYGSYGEIESFLFMSSNCSFSGSKCFIDDFLAAMGRKMQKSENDRFLKFWYKFEKVTCHVDNEMTEQNYMTRSACFCVQKGAISSIMNKMRFWLHGHYF